MPASTIVTHDDKHWLYYDGANERHGTPEVPFPREHAIGLATLRLDGFVCLRAGQSAGEVVSKPFRLEGDALEINVDARNGEFAVEILDRTGKPMPGFSGKNAPDYKGVDGLRFRPRWKSAANLSRLTGKVIRLRFRLRRAKLYAFQVVQSKNE